MLPCTETQGTFVHTNVQATPNRCRASCKASAYSYGPDASLKCERYNLV